MSVPNFTGPALFAEQNSVETPSALVMALYPKADGFYFRTSAGDEYKLTASLVSEGPWILAEGLWNDDGAWRDNSNWIDS